MGLLLRHYRPSARLVVGTVTPTVPDGALHPEPDASTDEARDPPGRSIAWRVARILLWTVLGLLLLREASEILRAARLRTGRAISGWWSDVERRSRSDTRRAEIGFLASWIGRH
jgi:hypothetical protein